MTKPPKGCPVWLPRCQFARNICAAECPPFVQVGSRQARCWLLQPDAPAEGNPLHEKTGRSRKEGTLMEQPILQVEHLTKFFSVGPHAEVHAVDDVNFTLRRGRTFGLVGESGCGKSSCARTIIAFMSLRRARSSSTGRISPTSSPARCSRCAATCR